MWKGYESEATWEPESNTQDWSAADRARGVEDAAGNVWSADVYQRFLKAVHAIGRHGEADGIAADADRGAGRADRVDRQAKLQYRECERAVDGGADGGGAAAAVGADAVALLKQQSMLSCPPRPPPAAPAKPAAPAAEAAAGGAAAAAAAAPAERTC